MSETTLLTPEQILADRNDPLKASSDYEAEQRAYAAFEQEHPAPIYPDPASYPTPTAPTIYHLTQAQLWFEVRTDFNKPTIQITIAESTKTRRYTFQENPAILLHNLQTAIQDWQVSLTTYHDHEDALQTYREEHRAWATQQSQAGEIAKAQWLALHHDDDYGEILPF